MAEQKETLSPEDQRRVDAGKANAAREKEALKNQGPVVKSYDPATGKTSTKSV